MIPNYCSPGSVAEALEQLQAARKTVAVAGGTDLVPELRRGDCEYELVVDLNRLPLRYIQSDASMIRLGAGVTHTMLIESDIVQTRLPALAAACREIGGPPVRNRGTLGGNLANASPAADTAPPLLAYDAHVVLARATETRRVALEDFFVGPRRTVLAPGEIILEVQVPLPDEQTAAAFIKLGRRSAMAIAVVSVAARLTVGADGCITAARIALGSVAPTPVRACDAEAALVGAPVTPEQIASAAGLARLASRPISDIRGSAEYRARMVEVLCRRVLATAWGTLEGRVK